MSITLTPKITATILYCGIYEESVDVSKLVSLGVDSPEVISKFESFYKNINTPTDLGFEVQFFFESFVNKEMKIITFDGVDSDGNLYENITLSPNFSYSRDGVYYVGNESFIVDLTVFNEAFKMLDHFASIL